MAFLLVLTMLSLVPVSSREELVEVPAGEIVAFWNEPENRVESDGISSRIKLKSFQLMKHQVTQREFNKFLSIHPNWKKENASRLFVDATYLESHSKSKSELVPVTNISWFAARAYCESIAMRLPTQDEWEYAAAASETKRDANSDEKFLMRILAWYGEPKGVETKSVGSIYKNVYGIWDMHGLVWEWVEDFNSQFVTGESREDSSFNKNMFCGGGIIPNANKQNYAAFMRFAFRSSLKGNSSVWNLGFRCARSL